MNYLDLYNKNGYFTLENIYSLSEIMMMKDIIKNLDLNKYEHSKDKSVYPFRITNIIPKNEKLKKIVEKPKILSILKECIGDDVIFFKDKYVAKEPDGKDFVAHVDGAFITYNYRLKKETPGWWTYASKFIHLQIMVTDNTEENGCLRICKRESSDPYYYIKKYFLNDRSIKSGLTDPKFFSEIK